MINVGLTLPSFVEDPEIAITVARAAEDAHLDGVFVYDHVWRGDPPNRRPALECFALLGAVVAETTKIKVGTLVARATLRPPAVLAHTFTTADRISGGRVIAGIGAGDTQSRAENEAFGLGFGTMVDRINALHEAVRATQGNGVPVWVGGRAAQVREIAAIADGWNGWGADPQSFAAQVALDSDDRFRSEEASRAVEMTLKLDALITRSCQPAPRDRGLGRDLAHERGLGGE